MLGFLMSFAWPTLLLVVALARANGKGDYGGSCAKFDNLICKDQFCNMNNVSLTLDPVQSYYGGSANLTAYLNSSYHSKQLVYLFCYLDRMWLFDFTEIGCIETNSTNATISFTWNVTGITSASVYVFNVTNGHYIDRKVGCVLKDDITVGENETANVSINLSEAGRPINKTGFYAGNITINASAILSKVNRADSPLTHSRSGCCDDQDSGSQTINYTFHYSHSNVSLVKTVTNNSHVLFVVFFEAGPSQFFSVKLLANVTNGNKIFQGSSNATIDVVEKVNNAVFTINNNQTLHKNDMVPVNITVSGTHPITAIVSLVYVSDPSDRLTYNCSRKFPIKDTMNDTSPSILNQCQFNRTGKFQFGATFENNASSYSQTYAFSISDGPPPVVVASSTIAVAVVVVLIVVVLLSIIVIFVYIPYQSYKKRVTETANFSFIDLRVPSRWERFKIKLENWKNRVLRRDSRLGLINYTDVEEEDLLGNLYGSLNSRKS